MESATRRDSPQNAGEAWTTRRLVRWIDGHLAQKGIDSPRVCAEMLLSHVLGCERMRLYMEADRPASADELDRLRALVVRASRHEPVQYLVGEAWFWSKRFAVGPSTLIPRPATEHLVEEAVGALRAAAAGGAAPVRMLEIGTGTGCISACVAASLRGQRRGADPSEPGPPPVDVRIVATDLVPDALGLARENLAAHRVADAVELRAGDLFAPLGSAERGTFHVLASNPPYVRDDEWAEMAPNVRDHEPRTALAGGPAGMDVLAPLIAGAHEWLVPGGTLACEIGHRQRDDALAAARANPSLSGAEVRKDFEGFWRLLVARRAG
ncbi:MAG: peptide chain release factor N(5)-glutamine methyltransferase [Phycisphaerales bacterium]|nr:peptide chain release factor N(5)-glutamine methyltransferase [Phycisphaerales bacterium]